MPLYILPDKGVDFMNIQPVGCSVQNVNIDWEEQQIIRRLKTYGVKPTGNKTTDRAKLHQLELQEAKKSTNIKKDFFTISESDLKEIQQGQQEQNMPKVEPDINQSAMQGATILGEQLFLAHLMKKKIQNI